MIRPIGSLVLTVLLAAPLASAVEMGKADGTITIKLNFSVPLTFSAPQAPGTGSPFTWDGSAVGTTIKDDALEQASLGAVKFGFAVLYLLFVYELIALAGTSPVLVS